MPMTIDVTDDTFQTDVLDRSQTVPVVVDGPWDNLSYRPDLAGAVGSAAKGKALEQLEKNAPGVGELGKRLFGR